MPTSPPTVDELPDAPNRGMSDDDFVDASDAWVAAQPPYRDQLVDLGGNVYANAVEAAASAVAALLAQAGAEAASAAALLATEYVGESTSSLTMAAGAKTVHLTAPKTGFANGRLVALVSRADYEVRLYGIVSGWDGADDMTVTVASDGVIGSGGPYADWLVMDAAFISMGATGAEVRALLSAFVFVTPKSIADALTFVDDGTGSGTYAPDHAAGMNHKRTINGNSTLAALSNPKVGEAFYIEFRWAGAYTLSINSGYKFFGSAADPSTTNGAIDAVSGVVISASPFEASCTYLKARQA